MGREEDGQTEEIHYAAILAQDVYIASITPTQRTGTDAATGKMIHRCNFIISVLSVIPPSKQQTSNFGARSSATQLMQIVCIIWPDQLKIAFAGPAFTSFFICSSFALASIFLEISEYSI